jgi:anti-sigma factor RsiW
MNCDLFRQSLQPYLDRELDQDSRRALEAHVATCAACRTLLADLEAIQATAATLDRHKPSKDVWARIALQVSAEPAFQQAAAARRDQDRRDEESRARFTWPVLAMAAGLLIALVAGSLWVLSRSRVMTPSSIASTRPGGAIGGSSAGDGNAASGALVESIEQELQQAAAHYEKAIAGLEQVANASDSPLDPGVMATLKKNLTVIDHAIDESRTALRTQPTNSLAQESLFEAFRRKVALLQDTIALMNEMRKGNQAGAARIVEGLSKS